MTNADGGGCKYDFAPGITQLVHGEERMGLQSGDNVYATSGRGQAREVEVGFVGRIHKCTIRIGDANRGIGDVLVDHVGRDSAEVSGAATVCNGRGHGTAIGGTDGGGTYMSGR